MRDRESDKEKRMKEIHEEGKAGFQPSMEFCLPFKTLLPKRAFFFSSLSAHFLLVSFPKLIVVFLIFLNIEFSYPYTYLGLLSTPAFSLPLNFLFSFLRPGNTNSYLIYTVSI